MFEMVEMRMWRKPRDGRRVGLFTMSSFGPAASWSVPGVRTLRQGFIDGLSVGSIQVDSVLPADTGAPWKRKRNVARRPGVRKPR